MEISKNKLLTISGGGISGSVLNSIARCLESILDLGRSLGSAIRRMHSGTICPI